MRAYPLTLVKLPHPGLTSVVLACYSDEVFCSCSCPGHGNYIKKNYRFLNAFAVGGVPRLASAPPPPVHQAAVMLCT